MTTTMMQGITYAAPHAAHSMGEHHVSVEAVETINRNR